MKSFLTKLSPRRTYFGTRFSAGIRLLKSSLAMGVPSLSGSRCSSQNFSTFLGRPGLYLEDLFILPEWRNRGFGRKLLAHVASIAVDRGCGRLEWVVLDWNERALKFYRSLGAQTLDEWTVCRLTGDALERFGSAES